MINLKWVKKYCKDYTLIENYNEAVNDTTQTWVCHHILGEILTHEQLKEHDFYYDVPPCMLKFVTKSEHSILHNKGKALSAETRRKLSIVAKGSHRSEETKRKMSEAHKGRIFSEEHCRNISKANKGHKGWNKGIPSKYRGIKRSDEIKKKMSDACKGRKLIIGSDGKRHWYK